MKCNPTMLTKYDEFGNTYYEWKESSDTDNSYKYTGKPLDKETGLYYYGARYYNPEWGRWVSRDSVRGKLDLTKSLNRYQYCYNNPIGNIDLDGNWPESKEAWISFGWGAVRAIAGAAETAGGIIIAAGGTIGSGGTASIPSIAGGAVVTTHGIYETKKGSDEIWWAYHNMPIPPSPGMIGDWADAVCDVLEVEDKTREIVMGAAAGLDAAISMQGYESLVKGIKQLHKGHKMMKEAKQLIKEGKIRNVAGNKGGWGTRKLNAGKALKKEATKIIDDAVRRISTEAAAFSPNVAPRGPKEEEE